jgi:quercetin dioxygenase-like cupin family protein
MHTNKHPYINMKRRDVMIAGLAGVSALLVGKGDGAWAQPIEKMGRVDVKALKPVESMIPGFPKVRLREATWQPGASSKAKMQNAMICECTRGTLEVTADDRKFTVKKGDVWTCSVGLVEGVSNKGKGPGTMRIFDLLTA